MGYPTNVLLTENNFLSWPMCLKLKLLKIWVFPDFPESNRQLSLTFYISEYMARFFFEAYTYFEKKYHKLSLFFSKRKLLFLDSFLWRIQFFRQKIQMAKGYRDFFSKMGFLALCSDRFNKFYVNLLAFLRVSFCPEFKKTLTYHYISRFWTQYIKGSF